MYLPEFARQHDRFLLFSNGDEFDYWPRSLVRKGYTLQMLDTDLPLERPGGRYLPKKNTLYLVDQNFLRRNRPSLSVSALSCIHATHFSARAPAICDSRYLFE